MWFPSKEQIAALREQYPCGMRVELLGMDDPQARRAGSWALMMQGRFSFGGRQDRR